MVIRLQNIGVLPRAALASAFLYLSLPLGAATEEVPKTALAEEDMGLESARAARTELQRNLEKYNLAIQELEVGDGAFAVGLPEQLLGFGLALQRSGDHEQAVEVFKRGVHLSRIGEGLYNPRQLALLRGEIDSHVALGELEAADERQRYLYRVQLRTLTDRSRGEALMRQAHWQRQAYEANLGETPYNRLLSMGSLHRLALTEIAGSEGDTSPELLPPLYGMLRAQYLASGFVGETTGGRYRTRYAQPDLETLQLAYRGQSYKHGAAIIRAIYDVRSVLPEAGIRDTAEPMLMLGDWQLWHGKRDEAFIIYGELERELAALDDAQALRAELFEHPMPLPALEGVRAFPPSATDDEGKLLVEFGVNSRGKVVNLKRLDENPAVDEKADDIMRRLRKTPFRPRISDGLPVDTAGMVVAYDIANW